MLHPHLRRKHQITHKGRVLVYYPEHPCAWKNGYIYLHRLVMENKLGRYLCTAEIVHHKNGDPLDNRLCNLTLMTNQIHSHQHTVERHKQQGTLLHRQKCAHCGKLFQPENNRRKYCGTSCHREAACVCKHPTADELAELVWRMPLCRIGAKFGVSGKAVEKWCVKMGIARPGRGYWAKQYAKNTK